MPWPFSRKKGPAAPTPASGPQAPRAAGADQTLVDEILAWCAEHRPGTPAHQDGDRPAILLGPPPPATRAGDTAPPSGALLKVKRGKLTWVDLYDPRLRPTVNDLIRELDRQQKWSFNGVVSTRYDEAAPSRT